MFNLTSQEWAQWMTAILSWTFEEEFHHSDPSYFFIIKTNKKKLTQQTFFVCRFGFLNAGQVMIPQRFEPLSCSLSRLRANIKCPTLKENTLLGIVTWSVLGKQHREAKKVYSCFEMRTHCYTFMTLTTTSNKWAADWLSQTHMKNCLNFSCGDAIFLHGGSPYKAL